MANPGSPKVTAVVGGQWGDEGKGKIIDYLAQGADFVIRSQGGDNAGHTVVNSKGKFKLNLIPSGIFNPQTVCIIGPGTVVNPDVLIEEIKNLNGRGIDTSNLVLSQYAHLILPYHIYLDSAQEASRGENQIGTTKRGIGPSYASKVQRRGLRGYLLLDPKRFRTSLEAALKQEAQNIEGPLPRQTGQLPDEFKPDYYSDLISKWCKALKSLVADSVSLVAEGLKNSRSFLIEGAQGTLIDLDYGTYPFTTSSNPSVNGLLLGAGIPGKYLTQSIGIFKAYQTKVGAGAMPTELKNEMGNYIREAGFEYGTRTGRPRRVGYFDAVAARYSHKINGFTNIALTRLDVLTGVESLKICHAYKLGGKLIHGFPADDYSLQKCEPVYQKSDIFKPWTKDISKIRRFSDLPKEAQNYCLAVAKLFPDAKLSFIGVGPERESLIKL